MSQVYQAMSSDSTYTSENQTTEVHKQGDESAAMDTNSNDAILQYME